MIGDASSELLARFAGHDSSAENRRLLKTYLEQNGRPLACYTGRTGPELRAQQTGIAELTNTKPSDREARGSCRSAACFGADPVASARGSEDRRDPAPDSHHPTTASPATRPKPDISTWQRLGHFYLALTTGQSGKTCLLHINGQPIILPSAGPLSPDEARERQQVPEPHPRSS